MVHVGWHAWCICTCMEQACPRTGSSCSDRASLRSYGSGPRASRVSEGGPPSPRRPSSSSLRPQPPAASGRDRAAAAAALSVWSILPSEFFPKPTVRRATRASPHSCVVVRYGVCEHFWGSAASGVLISPPFIKTVLDTPGAAFSRCERALEEHDGTSWWRQGEDTPGRADEASPPVQVHLLDCNPAAIKSHSTTTCRCYRAGQRHHETDSRCHRPIDERCVTSG